MQKPARARTSGATKRKKRATTAEFTDQQKLAAVTATLSINSKRPLSNRGIAEARSVLGRDISADTLSRWVNEFGDQVRANLVIPANAEIIVQTQEAVLSKWAEVRRKALEDLAKDDKLKSASYRDVAIVAGISDDHINKMTGFGPDVTSRMGKMEDLCRRLNIDMLGILDRYIQVLEQNIQIQTDKNIKQLESGSAVG